MEFEKDPSLQEWTREQPLSVLALDSADRAVLRIAGRILTMLIACDLDCFFMELVNPALYVLTQFPLIKGDIIIK